MAKKISELDAASTPLAGTELVEVVQGGVNKRVAVSSLSDGGTGSTYPAVVSEAGTSRTLTLEDAGKYIRTTNGSAVTITVPPQSSVTWATDTEVHLEQAGAGQVSIAAGAGVTINRVAGTNAKCKGQYAVVSLKRVSSDTWTLFGLLEASA